ncbi:MAG: DNA topoisomerase, partial [Nanopusillaceae archaeon]
MVREFTHADGYSLKKDKSFGKALILTEKPSVASDFAKALSASRKDGYYESTDYFIVWGFGHLVDIDDSELPEKWRLEDLPIFVKKFKYKPISRDHEKQLNVIKRLLKDTEYVIIATDQAREGELIARLILHYLGWKGRTFRFWTSLALSKEVIREGLRNLYPINEFDSLFWSALARQHADFVVGINFTRYVTLKMRKDSSYEKNDNSQSSGVSFKSKGSFSNSSAGLKNLVNSVWSVGRVQTPTLALVVERDREIENFKKVKYYEVVSVFESKSGFKYSGRLQKRDLVKTKLAKQEVKKEVKTKELKSETEEVFGFTKEEALKIVNELKDIKKSLVTSIEESRRAEKPPGLFTLASLQKEASAKFGFSAEKTHAIAQKLYQDYKVISYPRTDCPFLPGALVEKVKKLLTQFGYGDIAERVSLKEHKDIFNDVKLTDHHGIIPLGPLPSEVLPDSQEGKIYDLIVKRFIAAFMPSYRYKIYTVKTKLGDYFFTSRFRIVEDPGWRAVY